MIDLQEGKLSGNKLLAAMMSVSEYRFKLDPAIGRINGIGW
jgi:hypothetical protein